MSKNKEEPIKQENKAETVHKWSMLDGYTYFTFESKRCTSCKCDPCDCDWGTNEESKDSNTER